MVPVQTGDTTMKIVMLLALLAGIVLLLAVRTGYLRKKKG